MKYTLFFIVVLVGMGCIQLYPRQRHHSVVIERSLLDTCDTKECLLAVLKKEPDNVEAHWWLGTKLQSDKNYVEAIKEFDIAIKLDPSYNLGYPYRDRANCKNNLRNDSGAVADMTEAIKLNPTERFFYKDRGDYLSNLQQYDSALNDFNRALEIFDKYQEARLAKATVLVEMKRYKEAVAEYDILNFSESFMKDPNNVYDVYFRGFAKFNSGDKNGACADWARIADKYESAKIELENNCK